MSQLSTSKYAVKGNTNYAFATYPDAKIYKESTGSKWGNHLLFGDYIRILDTTIVNGRVKARSRNTTGWVKVGSLQKNRILEVNFIDIGQGDGCHIVTPDDQHFVVDAGKTDNMNRYLSWRFNLLGKTRPLPFPITIVISHSDLDHYGGFSQVFDNKLIPIEQIYHNGLVERPGDKPLGVVQSGHITGLVENTLQMEALITLANNRKGTRSTYCKTLYKAYKNKPGVQFASLAERDDYVPGFGKTNKVNGQEMSIRILGPVLSDVGGKKGLKSIKDLGKDKNGHSVILKLQYGKVRILLGGDVNTEFGELLHAHYAGKLDTLTVDVAKACHHGSNHFHYGFLEAINAAATVISSGDDEAYAHPRPDTIGALGKCGYGTRPLIFSTELARSNKEITRQKIEEVAQLLDDLKTLDGKIKASTDVEETKKLKKAKIKVNSAINSNLTRYGMINVRTDGERMVMAQRLEADAGYGKWDIHQLEYSTRSKRLELVGH
jgi:beta-lactamase superfamily II metal-dependent hydrolase